MRKNILILMLFAFIMLFKNGYNLSAEEIVDCDFWSDWYVVRVYDRGELYWDENASPRYLSGYYGTYTDVDLSGKTIEATLGAIFKYPTYDERYRQCVTVGGEITTQKQKDNETTEYASVVGMGKGTYRVYEGSKEKGEVTYAANVYLASIK